MKAAAAELFALEPVGYQIIAFVKIVGAHELALGDSRNPVLDGAFPPLSPYPLSFFICTYGNTSNPLRV